MTTAKQARAIAQAFLARNPDTFWTKRCIVLKPITHILRVIELKQISGKDGFDPDWGVTYMFAPRRNGAIAWAETITRRRPAAWRIGAPDLDEELAERIDEVALPILRSINTMQDFMALTLSGRRFFPRWDDDPGRQLLFQAAMGDLEGARRTCCLLWHPELMPRNAPHGDDLLDVPQKLGPLLAKDDRADIAQQLRAWEQQSARHFGVEKHWQPTPFPIEEQVETGLLSAT
ncbi:hypothetical protein GCM10007301_35690 [Azorhizobium oxalatiphilum]|uniref:Uncharacterized protein n=1 Tax=Azorhizobium oxalatiphilum TaxID=980631 RepID=A0A917C6C5_9HYPH|nr:hypothetical protein [Azorhizobium oxalatiphilum]GGF72731.1 hypothetical protein GCM10007301_35690 [Azorhizobium oxalatiphilum]